MTHAAEVPDVERTDGVTTGPHSNSKQADIVVIGGGSAGLGAVRAARRRGASVILIEENAIGGDCTFTGCVPSKALLEAAGRGQSFNEALAEVRRAITTVAATEDASRLGSAGIAVVIGSARFADSRSVLVNKERISARKAVIIATGATPAIPPIPGLENVPYLTSETLFEIEKQPSSLAILGGGPIGVEMADAFSRLGSSVTIVEAAERILPREEHLASAVIASELEDRGVTIACGALVSSIEAIDAPSGIRIHLAEGKTVEAEVLLVAVGRTPATRGLDLARAGIEVTGRGFINVNARLRTTARRVFAAGDVAEQLQFTHVAYRTGLFAARNALSPLPVLRFRPEFVPWVTFTSPEVARIGLTEEEAARHDARVAYLPMDEVDRAIAADRTRGFVKLIVGPRFGLGNLGGGRLLGATIVAERAGEMLQEVVLAMRSGMFPARLALTIHAYPTWSTAVQQAAAQFFGEYGGRHARPASADVEAAS